MANFFIDTDASFGVLTETWMNEKNVLRIKNDLKMGHGLEIISRERKGRKGGGVAIVWNDAKIKLKHHSMFTGEFEIIVASAGLMSAKTKMYIFGVYYPPSISVENVSKMNGLILEEIEKIKTRECNPIVIIAGDTNLKDLSQLTDNFPDIVRLNVPPTRLDNCLDVCFANVNEKSINILPPLASKDGIESDHKTVEIMIEFPKRSHAYEKVRKRKMTKAGEDKFCRLINDHDWSQISTMGGADEKSTYLHNKIEEIKDSCFPFVTSKRRDDDDPWITDHLRKLSNKKKKEFGRNGKSARWFELTELSETRTEAAKKAYYDRELEKMYSGKKGLAYTALNRLKCAEKPKSWTLSELDKDKPLPLMLEEVADFFAKVSNENNPVDWTKVRKTYDRATYVITPEMIAKRILETKRPSSMVPGDVPPRLIPRVVKTLSKPLCEIYNLLPTKYEWPQLWKMEYQTMIPKKSNPESLGDVRNLSCTNFFSKVLETFVIDSLRSEVELSELQYGGLKGTGADHFLCEVWNNVLETLEDPGSVVGLMSVDFSKTFNRIDHTACLNKLSDKSASNQTLGMIHAFLKGRKMKIRSGNEFSTVRPVQGGSPQGTKLGNLLFCLTIDDLPHGEEEEGDENRTVLGENAIPEEYRPQFQADDSGALDESFQPNPFGFRAKKNVINDTMEEAMLSREEYEKTNTWQIGYVDDINVGEELKISNAKLTVSTRKQEGLIRAKGCENMYSTIKKNGKKVGLRINPSKTQLLCFTCNSSSNIACEANIEGKLVRSDNELKILGFLFGRSPSVGYHVNYMIKKFNRSIWSVRHLKRARLEKSCIVRAYASMMRPILEFASNTYGPMLSKTQVSRVEACQRRVLRIIFGFDYSYTDLLSMSGLDSLESRREEAFKKFSIKAAKSIRFSRKWLPRYDSNLNVRGPKKYI